MKAKFRNNIWLTSNNELTHFSLDETKCPHCGLNELDQEFIDKLERLRIILNTPIYVLSSCRCKEHNKQVGGMTTSAHLPVTKAADIYSNKPINILYFKAVQLGFNGIGLYKGKSVNFIHVDTKIRRVKHLYWFRSPLTNRYVYDTDPYENWRKFKILV